MIYKALKNDIAIYAIHTNLDNIYGGVSFIIAKKLNLLNSKILKPKENTLTTHYLLPKGFKFNPKWII